MGILVLPDVIAVILRKQMWLWVLLLTLALQAGASVPPSMAQDSPPNHLRYLGQKPPGLKPKIFARGLVSSSQLIIDEG